MLAGCPPCPPALFFLAFCFASCVHVHVFVASRCCFQGNCRPLRFHALPCSLRCMPLALSRCLRALVPLSHARCALLEFLCSLCTWPPLRSPILSAKRAYLTTSCLSLELEVPVNLLHKHTKISQGDLSMDVRMEMLLTAALLRTRCEPAAR